MATQIAKTFRRRGIILSPKGFQKFRQAKLIAETDLKCRKAYTLEIISEKTSLSVNTISKVLSSRGGVDKQTLVCLFSAFDLTLETDDYRLFKREREYFDINFVGNSHLLEYPSPNSPGGQLPLESHFYIERLPLESICCQEISKLGAQIIIKAPKQMGKSSLILRIMNYANSLGYQTIDLSLQLIDSELLTSKKRFFQWFCARVSKTLGLANQVASVWDDQIGCKSNATDYLADHVLTKLNCPLVVAIDEMDQIFTNSKLTYEFFTLLRSWSEMAKQNYQDSWQKLRFVMAFSTDISQFGNYFSLLNTGLFLDLPLFTTAQVQELARRYGLYFSNAEIKNFMNLTEGHPYQTQLAFYQRQNDIISLKTLM
jgi:hypothetical protein